MSVGLRPSARPGRLVAVAPAPGRLQTADLLLLLGLAVLDLLVHDLRYVFATPYWTDESWVAVSTRLPLHDLLQVTAVTPAGWTLLLRAVPLGGDQRLRVVPLLFSVAAVLTIYLLVSRLPWRRPPTGRLAGLLAGIALLRAPSLLVRNDLKQYTADAFVTLVLLVGVARLEAGWTRRRLVQLALTCAAAFLFSAVTLFVALAAFAALLLTALARRAWGRAREVACVGAVLGLVLGAVFLLLYAPARTSGLTDYWQGYYLPVDDPRAALRLLHTRWSEMAAYQGLGPLWLLLVLLVAGVAVLALRRRPALALTVPLLVAEMTALGALRVYPLFDQRTSTFVTAAFAFLAAVAAGAVVEQLAGGRRRRALLVAGVMALATVGPARPWLRAHTIGEEDLRTPVRFLAQHRQAQDVVLLTAPSNWDFGVYWRQARPERVDDTANLAGFLVAFPADPLIVPALDRTPAGIASAVARADALARPGARVWLVSEHSTPGEDRAFAAATAARGLTATPAVQRAGASGIRVTTLTLLTRPTG